MHETYIWLAVALGLLVGSILCEELGRRWGLYRLAHDPSGALKGTGVTETALFAVWGLLLAFTFSGAGQRFDMRRDLVGQEANAIGTAYLRLDLLAPEARDHLRSLFRRYLDTRLQYYASSYDPSALNEALKTTQSLQKEIWIQAEAASRAEERSPPAILLLPALNAMIDIVTTRHVAIQMHPPSIVFMLICLMSLLCSVLAGYSLAGGSRRNWLHLITFALTNALIVYVILDMEYPRRGLIRVDAIDQVLVDLRESMN